MTLSSTLWPTSISWWGYTFDIFMNLLHLTHLLKKAEDVLEAAKKQTIYEVLLNAMAAAKTKHSIELPKDSLYDELKTKTRQMPDDVKVK